MKIVKDARQIALERQNARLRRLIQEMEREYPSQGRIVTYSFVQADLESCRNMVRKSSLPEH